MQQQRLQKTTEHIQTIFSGDSTGHDWWHILRVKNLALKIAKEEGADLYITEMAALLHDLDDWKFNKSDRPLKAIAWLQNIGEEKYFEKIINIIENVSYKGAGVEDNMSCLEGKCVQDADRLDAIGAVGIARTFAYGGHKGHEIYNPTIDPIQHDSFEAYQSKTSHTINHFYEKLLLLKDRLHTPSAKAIAAKRHAYMQGFLSQFYAEWEGKSF